MPSSSQQQQQQQQLLPWMTKMMIPPLKSPPTYHFLVTITPTLLSTIGFICLIVASASCNFISINYDYYSSSNDNNGGEINSESGYGDEVMSGMEGYEGDGFLQLPLPTSLGIYCSSTSSSPLQQQNNNNDDDTMQIVSRTLTSLTIIVCLQF